jgi:hypothetical protein
MVSPDTPPSLVICWKVSIGGFEREGVDLDVSTPADWVGAAAATLMPLADVIRTHVFGAERIHADDTTVPGTR